MKAGTIRAEREEDELLALRRTRRRAEAWGDGVGEAELWPPSPELRYLHRSQRNVEVALHAALNRLRLEEQIARIRAASAVL